MPELAIPRSSPSRRVHALQSVLLDMYPHRWQVSGLLRCKDLRYRVQGGKTLTLRLLRRLDLLTNLKCLP